MPSLTLQGLEQGVGSLFEAALLNFPLDFSTLMKLSISLATANGDSASKVSSAFYKGLKVKAFLSVIK